MLNKIKLEHRQRLAAIYIRQSSPGQVKNNRESYRVQKGLSRRAEELGWHRDQIKYFEADQGVSASTPMARDDFDSLLRMIQDQHVEKPEIRGRLRASALSARDASSWLW
jgi:DNA invertase Pin-like site-specific DNA recombinase